MNPEEAVRAHLDVTDSGWNAEPVHWGACWPPSVGRAGRALAAVEPEHAYGSQKALPGQRVDLTRPMRLHPWWRL